MSEPLNVLFICTGNSVRSIMAEAVLNHIGAAGRRFRGFSAGSQPKPAVHPLALATLAEHLIPTEGLRTKSWNEFAGPGAPRMDFVITVCERAADEACPVWPGHPATADWGVPDPASVTGSDARRRRAFREAYVVLARRIGQFVSLTADQLSGPDLAERLRHIGHE